MEGEHTGENLACQVVSYLKEYGIKDKFISVTCDNASNNIAMINILIQEEVLKDSKFVKR